ncbi:MAG: gamma-glutamyltransferase family protein [Acidaminococcaceae bacterium]
MKMKFNSSLYPYSSRKSVVYANHGMVCTSQSLAAQAGLKILQQGGNAIDAAIASAICLTLLEPTGNGLGSDAFALVWVKNKLYGLNGSGYAPENLTAEKLSAKGITDEMPDRGWESVTVPGAPSAWATLHKRFGKLPFTKLFSPAIEYAENGFPVSPVIAEGWAKGVMLFKKYEQESVFKGWFELFAPNGKVPLAGELIKMPTFAKTFKLLAESYCEAYYRGEIADEIIRFSDTMGGYFSKADLAKYQAQWVEPIKVNYRGYDVWEIPPNGHGIVALMALNMLKGFSFTEREDIATYHKQIEAIKLAFADGKKYIADPNYMQTAVKDMLSEEYADKRRKLIGQEALQPLAGKPFSGGTVYLCTADNEGNMVSFIQSNFQGFGSGIVVPKYAISLNDRASGFSLDPQSDDYLMPGKKPYHTIIPGFLTKDGEAVGPFGVMGGFMQPQGHVQVITNTIDFMMNPQAALDAPRWQWTNDKRIEVESSVPADVVEGLRKMGHEVIVTKDSSGFGRGQIIWRKNKEVLVGATEPRADGTVAAW